MSSVTLGSRPPTYRARLFGSGAARRTKLPEPDDGDIIPAESPPGDVMAVGIGFVFCGITTGGRGGGGIWAGFACPLVVPFSYCCWPGAPAKFGGGGRDSEDGVAMLSTCAICEGEEDKRSAILEWSKEMLMRERIRVVVKSGVVLPRGYDTPKGNSASSSSIRI